MICCRILCLLAALMLSQTVAAFYCFEPSPTYLRMGEDYFLPDKRIEVKGGEAGLAIVENLKGEWQGRLSELICEGSEAAPEPYYREAEVEAEVLDSNTALFLLSMNKEYNGYSFSGDKVFLMNKGSMYSLRISHEHVSASERERRVFQGNNVGSRFVEVFSDIFIHNEDEITVEWLLFSNGVFVYSQRLILQRD